jgi:hypothetical protein
VLASGENNHSGGADKNLDQNDGTGGNPCFHIKIE